MLDFTSALYLGMDHAGGPLASRRALTTGVPAALRVPPEAREVERALAALTGTERSVLAASTLHAFFDLVPILARQAGLLRDDADLINDLATGIDATDAKALANAPAPLARRAVRALLRGEHPPTAAEVERVLQVARLEKKACEVAGGVRVSRSGGRMTVHL